MSGRDRAGPAVGEVGVQVLYLRAVIRVYGPWTTSQTISADERALAVRRVRYAGDLLADLEARLPRNGVG
ncbi:hypothetical protein SAMN04489712_115167 [Thermomonospora echinospora]|uniref:Uncharacterized protein n=1 Tax=Thermomonospora echinospora TaxID=1992 RepID=A0A1H6DEP7_9ACTN|nr:hypothetical protein SAMN04489712_115167 [Thermomonospora echinospora]